MKITIEFNDIDIMNYKKGIQDVLDIVSKNFQCRKNKTARDRTNAKKFWSNKARQK